MNETELANTSNMSIRDCIPCMHMIQYYNYAGMQVQLYDMLKYHQDLDRQLKILDKKHKEWHRGVEDSATVISWMDMKMKSTEDSQEPDDDHEMKDSPVWFRNFLQAFKPMHTGVEEAVCMAGAVECNLEQWQTSKCYLQRLEEHIADHRRQKLYLKRCMKELTERKCTLVQSLIHFDELNAVSCNYLSETKQCRNALIKCESGIRECNRKVQEVKKEKRKIKTKFDKVLEEGGKRKTVVIKCTSNLEEKCDKLQRQIRERSEELNSDNYVAKTVAERLKSKVTTENVIAAGLLAFFSGGIALAAAGVATARISAEVKEERDRELQRLKNDQDELNKCYRIIRSASMKLD